MSSKSLAVLLSGVSLLSLWACERFESSTPTPPVTLGETTLDPVALTITTNIISAGEGLRRSGFVYSLDASSIPTVGNDSLPILSSSANEIVGDLSLLDDRFTYLIRPFAQDRNTRRYGNTITYGVVTISTSPTFTPDPQNPFEGNIQGDLKFAPTVSVTNYGHCWTAESRDPTIQDDRTQLGIPLGNTAFTSTLSGYPLGTEVRVRAYATAGGATTYSTATTFTVKGVWAPVANVPISLTARVGAFSFVLDGKAYLGGGQDDASAFLKDFWEFDPTNFSFTQKADITFLSNAAAFALDGKGYVISGDGQGGILDSIHIYDPVQDSWNRIPSGLPMPATTAIAFSLDGKGYWGSGGDGSSHLAAFYEFDPNSQSWTLKANIPGKGRLEATAFALNGKGYVGTGRDDGDNLLNDFYEYDPMLDTWSKKQDIIRGDRERAISFGAGNQGFLGTGTFLTGRSADMLAFNPDQNEWSIIDPFPGGRRADAISFTIGDLAFVGFGVDENDFNQNDLWIYVPD
ncbi:MAG: hypothetical protein AAF824_14835 [Bacteroidota bacterium]